MRLTALKSANHSREPFSCISLRMRMYLCKRSPQLIIKYIWILYFFPAQVFVVATTAHAKAAMVSLTVAKRMTPVTCAEGMVHRVLPYPRWSPPCFPRHPARHPELLTCMEQAWMVMILNVSLLELKAKVGESCPSYSFHMFL